ncbi:MAG: CapA family protein [Dehalococcoidia bacterium]
MSKKSDSTLRIVMVGDVIITEAIDPQIAFGNTLPILQNGDITLANVEGVICDESVSTLPGKTESGSGGHVRMPSGPIESILQLANVDAVSTANNHTMDFGEEGLIQTLNALDKAKIPHAGSGMNIEEAHKPVFLDSKGKRIGFLSYTSCYVPLTFPAGENKPGCAVVNAQTAYEASYNAPYQPGSIPRIISWANPDHLEVMKEDVRKAKTNADIVIISWHWGQTARGNARSLGVPVEIAPCYVTEYQEEMAHTAIDAGADIIMGHHPHEPQGIEIYKGKPIFYSLGNFSFGGTAIRSIERDSCIAQVDIDSLGRKRVSILPIRISNENIPNVLTPRQGKSLIEYYGILSRKYQTSFKTVGKEVVAKKLNAKIEAPIY